MSTLIGKTALVTGSAVRIGRAIAVALANEGANLVLHYNSSESQVSSLKSELESVGVKIFPIQVDLRDPSAGERLFNDIISNFGGIDILINNASIYPKDDISTIAYKHFVDSINIHAWTPFQLGKCMYFRGNKGSIINILDTRLWGYDRAHLSYYLGKSMLVSITKVMALEFAPTIRVNAIAPGLILPPPGEDYEYLLKLVHTNLLNKHGSEEDIVKAVLFLINSEFITGQVIFVDGGRFLLGQTAY
ncbi:MAG: SDR family oxidoreductase [Candidatus Hydrogenedentes bacterium]|nr:SDR family oxidoreductase [Candidatus Hydrogenedentota bacterium]